MSSINFLRSALADIIPAHGLPAGTRLHGAQYEILDVISESPFAINYHAADREQQRPVVIKEYLPAMLAERTPGALRIAASDEAAFQAGLRSFLHEGRLLATCVRPALMHVQRSWREHGTAYMAMPAYDAPTLRSVVGARGGPPGEAELRGWLAPLLDALAALHAANCVHGDITPDSILITDEGALLLGFGAGRHAIAQALGMPGEALKPGYAAPEQYAADPAAVQGPWTDLYALGAVLRAAMTGRAPPGAPGAHGAERRARDRLPPLRELVGTRYSDALVGAVDAALDRVAARRPQDVAAFRALLERPAAPRPVPAERAAPALPVRHLGALLIGAGALCIVAFGMLGVLALRPPVPPLASVAAPAPAATLEAAPTAAGPPPEPSTAATAPTAPTITAAAAVAAPAPRAAPTAAVTTTSTAATSPPPRPAVTPSAGCSALIQRASLETLTPAEAARLKKECRP